MTPETSIIGPIQGKGADVVPLPPTLPAVPSLPGRNKSASSSGHPRRRTRSGATERLAAISARGAKRTALPLARGAETVAAYIAECAGHLKAGSIQRRLNAIAEAHKAVGLESPRIARHGANTMKGIRRTRDGARAEDAGTDGRYPRHGGRHGRGH